MNIFLLGMLYKIIRNFKTSKLKFSLSFFFFSFSFFFFGFIYRYLLCWLLQDHFRSSGSVELLVLRMYIWTLCNEAAFCFQFFGSIFPYFIQNNIFVNGK